MSKSLWCRRETCPSWIARSVTSQTQVVVTYRSLSIVAMPRKITTEANHVGIVFIVLRQLETARKPRRNGPQLRRSFLEVDNIIQLLEII